jgi:hypothetical protein
MQLWVTAVMYNTCMVVQKPRHVGISPMLAFHPPCMAVTLGCQGDLWPIMSYGDVVGVCLHFLFCL